VPIFKGGIAVLAETVRDIREGDLVQVIDGDGRTGVVLCLSSVYDIVDESDVKDMAVVDIGGGTWFFVSVKRLALVQEESFDDNRENTKNHIG